VLEKKTEIEMLQKRDAENQKSIATLETRVENYEGKDFDLAPWFRNASYNF
jgi:hypothetical protein